jgi:hypothetical protein
MIKDFETVNVVFNKSKYINEYDNLSIIDNHNPSVSGHSNKLKKKERYLSSIGEYYERKACFCQFSKNGLCKNMIGLNLIDNSTFVVNKFEVDKQVYFSDTCGCACFVNSADAIERAFFEFVERQSLIISYLTKTFKYKIVLEENLKREIIPFQLNYLKFYNISLIDSIFIVISIGIYNGKVNISLGAGYDIVSAIKKSVTEAMQIHLYYDLIERYLLKHTNSNKKDYFEYFMNIDPNRIKKAYEFLDESKVFYLNKKHKNNNSFSKAVKELNNKYKIEPILFFLSNKDSFKVAKIVDFKWFPSLSPRAISEEKIRNIENITGLQIDRNCNFIPFP